MPRYDFWNEFREFLKEYKVATIAIGFVMGVATNELVKSFVDNIFMPLLDPLIKDGTWETATWTIGQITFGWGAFLSALLNFLLLALAVFFLIKKLMKDTLMEGRKKKKAAEDKK